MGVLDDKKKFFEVHIKGQTEKPFVNELCLIPHSDREKKRHRWEFKEDKSGNLTIRRKLLVKPSYPKKELKKAT